MPLRMQRRTFITALALIAALVIVGFAVARASRRAAVPEVTVKIGTLAVRTEVARTAVEQRRGLSFRTSIPPNGGMLFPLIPPRATTFWMFGMRFPIDIIWINDGRVTGVVHNAQPPRPLDKIVETHHSPGVVSHVLEVHAGMAGAQGITVGDAVSFEYTHELD